MISARVRPIRREDSVEWMDGRAVPLVTSQALRTTGPKNLQAYEVECTLADLAASYAFGLAKNHAFVDGNKRVAFLSIGLFLAINGYRLRADQVDAIRVVLAVAGGELEEAGLAEWISRNMAERSGGPR